MRDIIYDLATRSADCIQSALALARVRGGERHHLAGAGTATLYDGLRGVLLLLNTPAEWHAGTIVRSMIESYSDVAGLVEQKEYEKRMLLESHIQQRRLYEALAKVGTVEGATDRVDYHANHVDRLKEKGVKGLRVSQRFDAAKLPVDFRLIYADLSFGAHSDYVTLHTRHLGASSGVRFGAQMTDYAFLKAAWVATVMAHGAAALLPHFADVDLAALERTLAPVFDYEASMRALRDESVGTGPSRP